MTQFLYLPDCMGGLALEASSRGLTAIRFHASSESHNPGFIVDSATGEEIFVHVSGLVDKVKEGDTVTYETARGKKGMNAVNVQKA